MATILEKDKVLARSMERLEFSRLLEFLAAQTKSDPGKSAALALAPSTDLDSVRRDLKLLGEMIGLVDSGLTFPLGFFTDLSLTLENASRGAILSTRDLLEILRMLEQAAVAKKSLHAVYEKYPGLGQVADRIASFVGLKARLEKTVDEHGEIRNTASAQLAGLRAEFASLRTQVQRNLESLISARNYSDVIQDKFFTERDGRFVVPVKSAAQSQLPGIVHDTSASGATVFLEPIEMVPQNNRLRVLEREIEAEIMRILESLTQEVAQSGAELLACIAALTELDVISAKAELARKLKAVIPVLEPGPALALYKVRHPLLTLKGKEAIPNDIVLDSKSRVIVISGPNTGGKTVFMKTVGILVLMVRAGMAIPAHPDSRIGFFPEVYAEIGDDQSLAQDLSSYSAHLLHLIACLEFARKSSLILVDEILGSTDPEEAAALAIAILRQLRDRECTTAVTTHLSRLKAFAESEPGFVNASFEFDPEKLTPTYHIRIGIPGPSYGIATAQKLGLEPALVRTAESMLEPESRRIMELLSELDRKQTDLDVRLRKLDEDERLVEFEWNTVKEKSAELSAREKTLKKDARKRLESELQSMKIRFAELYEQSKAAPSREKRVKATRELSQMQIEIEDRFPEPEMGQPVGAEAWQVGDIAWVNRLRLQATVTEIDRETDEATLAVGSIRLKENLSELRRMRAKVPEAVREMPDAEDTTPAAAPVQTAANTLDMRGKRAEEAEIELIDYLDLSAREAKPAVFIIHGHGTGALKKMTREYLAQSPYVLSFRPGEQGEGGDGVTVAFLERMTK